MAGIVNAGWAFTVFSGIYFRPGKKEACEFSDLDRNSLCILGVYCYFELFAQFLWGKPVVAGIAGNDHRHGFHYGSLFPEH